MLGYRIMGVIKTRGGRAGRQPAAPALGREDSHQHLPLGGKSATSICPWEGRWRPGAVLGREDTVVSPAGQRLRLSSGTADWDLHPPRLWRTALRPPHSQRWAVFWCRGQVTCDYSKLWAWLDGGAGLSGRREVKSHWKGCRGLVLKEWGPWGTMRSLPSGTQVSPMHTRSVTAGAVSPYPNHLMKQAHGQGCVGVMRPPSHQAATLPGTWHRALWSRILILCEFPRCPGFLRLL